MALRTDTKDTCVVKEIALRAQIFIFCARLNIQHNWEDLYDHMVSTRTFTLIMNKIFMSSKFYEEIGYDLFASRIRVVQF